MTEEEFYEKHKIIYIAGDDSSFVTVVNELSTRHKQYKVKYDGQKITIDSEEYTDMPDWVWTKIKPQIFNDYNVTDYGK